MKKIFESIFGKKISRVRVVPLALKIVSIFIVFLLFSNFITNYINLILNRGEMIKLMTQLLVKELKEIYNFASIQYDIYNYNNDLAASIKFLEEKSLFGLKYNDSIAIGIKPDGEIFFQASRIGKMPLFDDLDALAELKDMNLVENTEGSMIFHFFGHEYLGVYKYHQKWDIFLIRAENFNEFTANTWSIFLYIAFWIIGITLIFTISGIILINYIFRFLRVITDKMIKMQENQDLQVIELHNAPNDEITFLGVSFNALSSTITNLLNIFRKFVSNDLVIKAYREKDIRLEGEPLDLTILFTDIKGFTNMTEILGTDIITLLNLHYNRAINRIIKHEGIIGSIIGDALLAVFGAYENPTSKQNKSFDGLLCAYEIQENAAELRKEMLVRKDEIEKNNGRLSDAEERVYKAVLLEIGVGIDGGEVFYGNIGSQEQMTNTVIGDIVNSASRLEGLTREYNVPVICSEYVKKETENGKRKEIFYFVELDKVQVKGKTEAKVVYWPVLSKNLTPEIKKKIETFSRGLKAYYKGDWNSAYKDFLDCDLPAAEIFKERTQNRVSPKDWNGIWTMETK